MKRFFLKRAAVSATALLLLLLIISTSRALAQTPGDTPLPEAAQDDQTDDWRGALSLTPDQVGRIRSILQEKKFERQAARRRLNQAQRALDDAIYSDNATEAVIEQSAREVAEAQAAEIHLRAMTELNIRRVLTPEQLTTFRRIRQERLQAQREQRLNGNRPLPLRNQRLENSVAPQNQRNANPVLTPRERRALLRGRIRP
jgi:Spy/CpxP family protein refolding chaperone